MRTFLSRFHYRTVMTFVVLCLSMLLCVLRLFSVCRDTRLTAGTGNTVTVAISGGRGDIFDCKGRRITSSVEEYAIVFLPCEQGMLAFAKEATDRERESGLESLRQNKPTVLRRKTPLSGIGVYSFVTRQRYGDVASLEQVVGYLDETKHGVSGLEKAYDDLLFSSKESTASFALDAGGQFLTGIAPVWQEAQQNNALHLTIDREIQEICQKATSHLPKGAVVVSEIQSGKIRALVSRPTFDANRPADALERTDGPFVNRVFRAYSVGSVFKPLIAAAMLESGQGDFCHRCVGYSEFLGLRFDCNDHNGHGRMNLQEALSRSCNTYFYQGAQQVSAAALTRLAVSCGFKSPLSFGMGLTMETGKITEKSILESSSAAKANFAIGQGDVLLSPLVLVNLYSAIANDGSYFTPTLIEGKVKNGTFQLADSGVKNILFHNETATLLKEYLTYAVEHGTGKEAKPENGSAGGKTATAQTGRFQGEEERLNAWFCGFFPAENPKYTVVIMREDGQAGSRDCAPIFKKIAEEMMKLK